MSKDKVTWIVIFIVSVVWGIAVLLGIIVQDYKALGVITPVMLAVCGFLFGFRNGKKD